MGINLSKVRIYNVRNLRESRLDLARCNVFLGDNGSGKTSLMEAIFLLARGKSFRHHQPKHYIHHAMPSCTVWGENSTGDSLAISKEQDASTTLRHNGANISQSQMSRLLPLLVIDPSSMDVLETGSASRRQMLDWLCFYLQDDFHTAWSNYNRLLKQRNALLRPFFVKNKEQLTAWDVFLSQYATNVHNYRQAVFADWQQSFRTITNTLLPKYHDRLSLSYHAGYDTRVGLGEILAKRLPQDIELGYTRIGVHRADIDIILTHNGKNEHAINVLSRGEKKLLITALRLSQLMLLHHHRLPSSPLVLIDDLDSELDDGAILALLQALFDLPCQLFISSLNANIVKTLAPFAKEHDLAVFDIKDGTVTKQPKP